MKKIKEIGLFHERFVIKSDSNSQTPDESTERQEKPQADSQRSSENFSSSQAFSQERENEEEWERIKKFTTELEALELRIEKACDLSVLSELIKKIDEISSMCSASAKSSNFRFLVLLNLEICFFSASSFRSYIDGIFDPTTGKLELISSDEEKILKNYASWLENWLNNVSIIEKSVDFVYPEENKQKEFKKVIIESL